MLFLAPMDVWKRPTVGLQQFTDPWIKVCLVLWNIFWVGGTIFTAYQLMNSYQHYIQYPKNDITRRGKQGLYEAIYNSFSTTGTGLGFPAEDSSSDKLFWRYDVSKDYGLLSVNAFPTTNSKILSSCKWYNAFRTFFHYESSIFWVLRQNFRLTSILIAWKLTNDCDWKLKKAFYGSFSYLNGKTREQWDQLVYNQTYLSFIKGRISYVL